MRLRMTARWPSVALALASSSATCFGKAAISSRRRLASMSWAWSTISFSRSGCIRLLCLAYSRIRLHFGYVDVVEIGGSFELVFGERGLQGLPVGGGVDGLPVVRRTDADGHGEVFFVGDPTVLDGAGIVEFKLQRRDGCV